MSWVSAFFERLPRKAPGSVASTRLALQLLPPLPPSAKAIEFGCGSGLATVELARHLPGQIVALDLHQPYLDELKRAAQREGLADRVIPLRADLKNPPFADQVVDLIWCEASVYLMGFKAALTRWRRLLRPGGMLVLSELAWLTPNRPPDAVAFWSVGYPAMTTIDSNLATLRATGLEPLTHFIQPASDWASYYEPLQGELISFRLKQADNSEALEFADAMEAEVRLWNQHGDSYGYVFHLARRTAD